MNNIFIYSRTIFTVFIIIYGFFNVQLSHASILDKKSSIYAPNVNITINTSTVNGRLNSFFEIKLTATNSVAGEANVGNITATMVLPSSLNYISNEISNGIVSHGGANNTITWTVPVRNANSQTLTIKTKIVEIGAINLKVDYNYDAISKTTTLPTFYVPEPFNIDPVLQRSTENRLFISHTQTSPADPSKTNNYTLDLDTYGYPTKQLENGNINESMKFNAIAFNALDGYLYLMRVGNTLAVNKEMYFAGKDGIPYKLNDMNISMREKLNTSDANANIQFISGEIDERGYYYLRNSIMYSDYIVETPLNIPNPGLLLDSVKKRPIEFVGQSTTNIGFADFGLIYDDDVTKRHLYSIGINTGKLYKIDYRSEANKIKIYTIPTNNDAIGGSGSGNHFGALFGNKDKVLYGTINNGTGFYRIAVEDFEKEGVNYFKGEKTLLSNKTAVVSENDGSHNAMEAIKFNADLKITVNELLCYTPKRIHPNNNYTYSVVVENYGVTNSPGTLISIGDWLRDGITIKSVTSDQLNTFLLEDNNTKITADIPSKSSDGTINPITFLITINIPSTVSGNLDLTASLNAAYYINDPDTPNGERNSHATTVRPSLNVDAIQLSKTEMCFGDSNPEITITPNGTSGIWHSSNTAVATIDSVSGEIMVKSEGTVVFSFIPNDLSSCPPDPVTLVIKPRPLSPVIAINRSPDCQNGTGEIEVSFTEIAGKTYTYNLYNTSNLNVAIRNLEFTNKIFKNVPAGTYVVRVTANNSTCESFNSNEVIIVPFNDLPLLLEPDVIQPTCVPNSGSITIKHNPSIGTTFAYQFKLLGESSFRTNNSGSEITGLAPGTYVIRINEIPDISCAPEEKIVVLNAPDPIIPPVIEVTSEPTCLFPAKGEITITNYDGQKYNYKLQRKINGNLTDVTVNEPFNGKFTELTAGEYRVTVSYGNLTCPTDVAFVEIIVNATPPPPLPTITTTQPTCLLPNGKITLNATPIDDFIYKLYKITNIEELIIPSNITGIFDGLEPGNYKISVVNKETGCESVLSYVISILPAPSPPADPITRNIIQPDCEVDGSIEIDIILKNGYTYTLYSVDNSNNIVGTISNPTTNTLTFSNLLPGNYIIKVKRDLDECESAGLTFIINNLPEPPVPPTSFTILQPDCVTQTGTITISNPLSDFRYYLYYFNTNGQLVNHSNNTTGIFNNLAPGVYKTSQTNLITKCASVYSTDITINAVPDQPEVPVFTLTQPTCEDRKGSIQIVSPETSGFIYKLYKSDDLANTIDTKNAGPIVLFNDLQPGSYIIKLLNETTLCESEDTFVINNVPSIPPLPKIDTTQPTCLDRIGVITLNNIQSSLKYTLKNSLLNEILATMNVSNSSITYSNLAPGTYSLEVLNELTKCINTTSIIIDPLPTNPIVANIPPVVISCTDLLGKQIQLTPVSGLNYKWFPAIGLSDANIANPIANPSETTTYTLTVTDNTTLCDTTIAVTVTVEPNVSPNLTSEAPFCNGDGTYSVVFYSNGLVTAVGGTINGNVVTAPIGTSVVLTATNLTACANTTITVISPISCDVDPPCNLDLSVGQPVCQDENYYSVAISYTQGAIININAGVLNGNKIVNVPFGTVLNITATLNNCVRSKSVTAINQCPPPCDEVFVSYTAGICNGQTYSISFINPKNAIITSTIGTVTANAIINIPINSPVTITATLSTGCLPQVMTFSAPECPSINLEKTGVLIDEDKDGYSKVGESIHYNFNITNTGNVTLYDIDLIDLLPGIIITPSSGPFTLSPGDSKDFYTAKYIINQADLDLKRVDNTATTKGKTSRNRTVSSTDDENIILNENPDCPITIYNVLTPNGDGKNDYFKIEGIECYMENHVSIFNRWGVMVYDVDNYNNDNKSFKGKSEGRATFNKNELLPTGVYYYIIKYKDSNLKEHSKAGYLYLSL